MSSADKFLIFGASGQVGRELLELAGLRAVGTDRGTADITSKAAVEEIFGREVPSVIVNAAAYTAVDRAETEAAEAFAVNRDGAAHLAAAAASAGIPLIHISTDYVFDGTKRTPYREDDTTAPLGVYGKSKAAGEEAVRGACPRHIILRTSWVYSPYRTNFLRAMLRLGGERAELGIVDDQTGCPTAAADIAGAIINILDRIAQPGFWAWGTYHYCGADITTWYGFAQRIFALTRARGLKAPRLMPIDTASYPTPAKRPAYSVLATDKIVETFGIVPRPLGESLAECLETLLSPAPTVPDRV